MFTVACTANVVVRNISIVEVLLILEGIACAVGSDWVISIWNYCVLEERNVERNFLGSMIQNPVRSYCRLEIDFLGVSFVRNRTCVRDSF